MSGGGVHGPAAVARAAPAALGGHEDVRGVTAVTGQGTGDQQLVVAASPRTACACSAGVPWTWRSPTTSTDPCPACGARDATCGGSPLTEDPLHVVLPGTHPLGGRPVLNLAGLADEPWVLGCLKTEAYLRRYAEQAGFSPDVRGSTTDYFFARSLVAAGVGLSLIPTVALTPALPGVRAVPLDAPTPARHIGAAVLRRPARPEVTN